MSRKRNKKPAKKYFWKDVYVGSIPKVIAMFQGDHALAKATELQMLDQQTMSQEAFLNAVWIWFHRLLETKGSRAASWLEEELRGPFAELSALVDDEMKEREREKLPPKEETPEGFSRPDRDHDPAKKSPGKRPRSPRNGRNTG